MGLDISLQGFRLWEKTLESIIEHARTHPTTNRKVELAGNDKHGPLVLRYSRPAERLNLKQRKRLLDGFCKARDGAIVCGRSEEKGNGGKDVDGSNVGRVKRGEFAGAL